MGVALKRVVLVRGKFTHGGFNGGFSGMAEGRVADIVREAGGGDDIPQAAEHTLQLGREVCGGFLSSNDVLQLHGEGAAYVGNLQAMGEAGAHVVITPQREHLCFVLQAAKSTGV